MEEKKDGGFEDIEVADQDPDQDETLKALAKSVNKGQPKTQKIRDFKARVLSLLELYASKTKNQSYVFKALQGVFPQVSQGDVLKLDRVLGIALERAAGKAEPEAIDNLIEQYVGLLCKYVDCYPGHPSRGTRRSSHGPSASYSSLNCSRTRVRRSSWWESCRA
jgi:hypothetical protein